MKQLTCEMCGGTDLIKQDGVYVCQNCGMKYSVEEAKKMMIEGTVEVQGNVQVKNAAQLENLLNLAHSSFDSKNYAQAEEFCNQVIAMDAQNYDAWKLKGEAINYQITASNQRILEVYNCIMTSYRVLDAQQKEEKKDEVLSSLKTCLEEEVNFWLNQFEADRPTKAALKRAQNAYVDAYNKISDAFDELGLEDSKAAYLINFDNFFIKKANSICVSAWKTTVGYNYYRDDFKTLGKNWGKGSAWSKVVTTDTNSYRPIEKTAVTFMKETDNLIDLLRFAEKQFNKETTQETKEDVYGNIIYFHERVSEMVYYTIGTSGYDVGWCLDGGMTDAAKEVRRRIIEEYQEKIDDSAARAAEDRHEEILEECKNKSPDAILKEAYDDLTNGRFEDAESRYCAYDEKLPHSPVHGVASAVCYIGQGSPEDMMLTNIRSSIKKSFVNENEKKEISKIVNFRAGNANISLLMVAASNFDYEVAKYLIELGADVNSKSDKYNVTPLWYVSRKKLDESKVDSARKIAKLLLDNGADVNVTNTGGVALYNKDTDFEIARMIKSKFPNAEKGEAAASESSGGCYVATAVYGSYDCPQVWTLRRFRDYTLAESWYGRLFVRTYYAISPTLVKWFGKTAWFKKLWKGKLDRMVAKLQEKGVEDTPYEDKKW